MSIGLRYGDADATETSGLKAGFLYFDAVTVYSKSLRGEVSKNPIATGRYVSDSFTSDNTVIQLSGVISCANISSDALIVDASGNGPFNNFNDYPNPVQINEDQSKLRSFLPSSLSQFLPQSSSSVTLDSFRNNYKDFVYSIFEILMSGELYNEKTGRVERRLRTVDLYEYTGNILTKVYPSATEKEDFGLVLTAADVKEDADTGDALVCDLTFEKVKFVKLKTTALPKDVVSSLKTKASAKQKKGVVNSKPTVKNTDDLSPEEQAQVDSFNKNKAEQ